MVAAEISRRRVHTRLGKEHPRCDLVQRVMIPLFFAAWGLDSFSYLVLGHSTVIGFVPLPARLFLAIVSSGFGLFLVARAHRAVFGEAAEPPRLIDSGVYSWVRHPMYLGTLLFCLGFFFAIPSLLSLSVWIVFFVLYDRMASYEEKDLERTIGDEYVAYQKRVPKWFPKPIRRS